MEAGVAEDAARRSDQAVKDLSDSLAGADQLVRLRKFGDNEDGRAAAEWFSDAGKEYIMMMENAITVFENMAATYRAAGRTVAEADAAGQRMFQSQPE